ncbi:hypothetical protein WG936_11010 [Corynebacterium sp. H127]|uniref:hypothetical protein n=1 Tax=Corynebacterium sp. H127 TaxID=3133418 RepID=UPI00309E4D23
MNTTDRKPFSVVAGVLAVAGLALSGCADLQSLRPAAPSTTTATETMTLTTQAQSPPVATPDVAKHSPTQPAGFAGRAPDNKEIPVEALESVWVPELCENPAGNLVGGRLPTDNRGTHQLVRRDDNSPLGGYTDINGDAKDEAVLAYNCDMGGTSWPDTLLIYDNDLNFVASYRGWNINGAEAYKASVQDITWDASNLHVQWIGVASSPGAMPSVMQVNSELELVGNTPTLTNLVAAPYQP